MNKTLLELQKRRAVDSASNIIAEPLVNFPGNYLGLLLSGEIVFLIDCPLSRFEALAIHITESHYSFANFRLDSYRQPRVETRSHVSSERSFIGIILTNLDFEEVDYYASVIGVFIARSVNLGIDEARIELDRLVSLFRLSTATGKGDVQGLWAELFCLLLGRDTSQGVKGWSQSSNSRFDFINPNWCLEVKSTLQTERIHVFSSHQMGRRRRKNVYVISVMLLESSGGLSVFDLQREIETVLGGANMDLRMRIAQTLGRDVVSARRYKFDWQYAKENWLMFKSDVIPKLEPQSNRILSYEFKANLEGLDSFDINDLEMLF